MSAPPSWLSDMANEVAGQIYGIDVLAPIGCHYHCADGIWEVTLFVARTEIVGGEQDGEVRCSNFRLDLNEVRQVFESIRSLEWQALPAGPDDELGPHISIEGDYRGQPVWVRILSVPPPRFQAGRYAKVYQDLWEETW